MRWRRGREVIRAATAETMFDCVKVVTMGLAERSAGCQTVITLLAFPTVSFVGKAEVADLEASSKMSFQTLMLRRL